MLDRFLIKDIVKNAVFEDIGSGDLSSNLIDNNILGKAKITSKEKGVICGLILVSEVYNIIDNCVNIKFLKNDGDEVDKGDDIAIISGKLNSILKGERVALNFLQRLSGIATMSKKYFNEIKEYDVKVTDTRKTTPGLRILEKHAVKIGGCFNHRYNLASGIMIKDNHIKALKGIKNAVDKARESIPHTYKIEVEVSNINEMKEALDAKADIIMLDNMDIEDMKKCVLLNSGKSILEASGNITLNNVKEVAKTGVNIISTGELTHSVKSLDISLNIY